jgi:hypothetical protein
MLRRRESFEHSSAWDSGSSAKESISRRSIMRAYIATTGLVFALLVLAHVWRLLAEGIYVARDPWLVGSTVLAAALAIWAWRLLRAGTSASDQPRPR